ncbi:DUF6147 family protein [Evansella sp. AB-P1]|uniref:DUF6147 family protein n=1 Tax=Evansella sp. AB-P1 TaxID=3037653 RepID=UPI00241F10FD|nr:DUF6147 family protein [Evansella sp. AB-P1]MDG5790165.1 DUF6147 family protein [Evansella sp. AB-P1]
MKKWLYFVPILVISLLIVALTPIEVHGNMVAAEEITFEKYNERNYMDGIETFSTQYLQSWGSTLVRSGSNRLALYGYTESLVRAQAVGVNFYLEYLNGNRWENVEHITGFVAFNDTSVNGNITFSVTKGYTYRIRGVHFVNKDGRTERVTGFTNSLYIN